jgi:hypothetical protein
LSQRGLKSVALAQQKNILPLINQSLPSPEQMDDEEQNNKEHIGEGEDS